MRCGFAELGRGMIEHVHFRRATEDVEVFESELYVACDRRWAELPFIAKRRGDGVRPMKPQPRAPDVMELGIGGIPPPWRGLAWRGR